MSQPNQSTIRPIILSGGAGTRLWPMSRALYPKQMLPLVTDSSLLQETALRVKGASFAPPIVICNDEHRFLVAEQFRSVEITPAAIVLEPEGRNTAPAVAAAAWLALQEDPDALLLVLPSDHAIKNTFAFQNAVSIALKAAQQGALVTFGIAPNRPETGYGYIKQGSPCPNAPGAFSVARFVEKPDRARAEGFLTEGGYVWNGGLFAFRADAFLTELERFEPAMHQASRQAVLNAQKDLDFLRLEKDSFLACPSRSIDYAVMERTDKAAVVPCDMGWSDVGSWSALWDIGAKDANGNLCAGDVLALDVSGSYLRADGPLLAVLGLDNVIAVTTDDAVLVAARERAQDVKALVEKLTAKGRAEPATAKRVWRPWGYYQGIDAGERFQVKRIFVKPGAALSLQRHSRRAEHWVVVEGTARVQRGTGVIVLEANQSTYIPIGMAHRLENPGPGTLHLIEVQSGDYLGEDDIERLADDYGRA